MFFIIEKFAWEHTVVSMKFIFIEFIIQSLFLLSFGLFDEVSLINKNQIEFFNYNQIETAEKEVRSRHIVIVIRIASGRETSNKLTKFCSKEKTQYN